MPERTVLCLDTLFVQGDDKKRYKNGEKENVSYFAPIILLLAIFGIVIFYGDCVSVRNILQKMFFSLSTGCVSMSNSFYEVGICQL